MKRDIRALAGATGLVCLACCIGPFLGAIGIATVAGVAIAGIGGFALALLAGPAYVRRRRPRRDCGASTAEPVSVAAPLLRPPR